MFSMFVDGVILTSPSALLHFTRAAIPHLFSEVLRVDFRFLLRVILWKGILTKDHFVIVFIADVRCSY